MDTKKFFDQAMQSSWGLKKLNFLLHRFIPFNRPHKLMITELKKESAKVRIPYIKKNLNHIKGIHACCLATATEYVSGIVIGNKYGMNKYRLIMQTLDMEYLYQGKMESFSEYILTDDILKSIDDFEAGTEDKVIIICEVKTHDTEGNHICTGKVKWQLKKWSKVRTK